MIALEKVSMSHGGHLLFSDVTFTLQKGEKCGLVGRNGSGKTTLFRLMTKKEEPDSGNVTMPKGYRVGCLDQHIHFTEPTLLQEALLGLHPDERDLSYKVEKILFGLGFTEDELEMSPHAFSGGYQLRLHLAKILASEPDCLLLDEPTNYLDIVAVRWFTKFLKQWKGEFILISHDREFMDSVTTHTAGLHANKLRKIEGSTVNFFELIVREEEIYERTRVNLQKKQEHLQSYIDRFGAKASKATQAQSKQKMLNRIPVLEKLKELYHLDFSFAEHTFYGKKMFEMHSASFAYSDSLPSIISNFSLTVEPNDRIAVVGKNGRGKSTLLKLLMHEVQPQSGTVKRFDNVFPGYFGQTNIERLRAEMTIEEEISQANPKCSLHDVRSIAGLMMFSGDLAKKPVSVLSGGEKSRVLLGKILATPCNALFLDEPTHHLDIESIEALIDALEDFSGAVVVATHSELLLNRLEVNKIVVCHQGRQELFLGNYREFLEKDGWEDSVKPVKEKKKPVDYHEEKRARAQNVQERSKLLKPLERKIEMCEKEIVKLEELQKVDERKLVDALQSQDVVIQALAKSAGERQKNIEALYKELEQLHSSYMMMQQPPDSLTTTS